MSYGIIRAWKGASEQERMQEFLSAILQTNTAYLETNCTSDVELMDITDNLKLKGIVSVVSHLKTKWNLGEGNFTISKPEMSYTESSEVASFELNFENQLFVGLAIVEEKNGQISMCKIALNRPS